MANVSSSNGLEKRPKLRFPGFDEPWEICTAEELFQNVTDKNHPDETVLTIVQGKGTLPREQAGRNIHYDDASLSNYKMVQKGDFIIHLRSFEGGLEMANENGIVSPAYTILRGKKPHSSRFYEAYFHTDEFVNHVLSKSVEGIRDGRQISYDAFKWLGLPYCSPSEQAKIAELFSVLTKRIEKQTVLVDSLKKYKRGALKAVFNQQASFVSESQKWDEYTMRDLISLQSGQDFAPAEYNDQGLGIPYMTGASCIVNGETVVSRWTQTPRCYAYRGDTLLVCKGSGSGAVVKLSQEKVHIARQFMSLRPNEKMTSDFCYYLTVFLSDKIKQNATGLIEGIDRGTVLNQTVFLPPLHEQKKIASFFSKLDFALSSQERLLDKIMSVRMGLMQQLFI
ncbi:restriction endonuclease subunit S [Flavonifractor plautii]|nr:restriction endonuclease subunit S [Flavonifractor plautii]QIA31808.1 restriction endonuclease subunit S [Flavonifractor plautii]